MIGTEVSRGRVRADWIDVNGHMNVAYYTLAFDEAVDSLWHSFGITEQHVRDTKSSTFAVESHILYLRELRQDDPYVVTAQILAYDEKRIHQFQRMYHGADGYLAATAEWMNLHVDMAMRRVAPWPEAVLAAIGAVAADQDDWPWPDQAGRRMRVRHPVFEIRGYGGGVE